MSCHSYEPEILVSGCMPLRIAANSVSRFCYCRNTLSVLHTGETPWRRDSSCLESSWMLFRGGQGLCGLQILRAAGFLENQTPGS